MSIIIEGINLIRLSSDIVGYINDFATNQIRLSYIIGNGLSAGDLTALPFYSKLVVDCSGDPLRDRDKYDLMRRIECLSNIRSVHWMIPVDAHLAELLCDDMGVTNLNYLTFGDYCEIILYNLFLV